MKLLSVLCVFSSRFRGWSKVPDSGKVMVTPSFLFPYHCAGVQHNQWIIYISPRAMSQANIKENLLGNFVFCIILDYHITGHMCPTKQDDLS